jgi:tetratricopeptide (TPR) repeat protein
MRVLAILLACHGVAAADFGEQRAGRLDGSLVLGPPDDIPVWLTPAGRERREVMYLGAFPETLHPFAKANLWLALGDLDVAKAVTNKLAAAELLERRDFEAAIRLEGEIESALYSANSNYLHATKAKHANWRGLPRALAHHAYALDLARAPEALVVHRRIVRDHPDSPFAPRSHVVLGDIFYTSGQLVEARQHYSAVATGTPLFRAYALWRRGAIDLEARAWKPAYDKLTEALALDPPAALAVELRRDITQAYARFGDANPAFDTFAHLAPAHAKAMLLDLAANYALFANRTDAAAVFAQLVRRFPSDLAACNWQTRVVEAAFLGTDPAQMFREAERLVRLAGRLRLVLPPDERLQCTSAVRELTLGAALMTLDKSLSRQLEDLWYASSHEDDRTLDRRQGVRQSGGATRRRLQSGDR